jgi:hypothetical protein|tara:strand:- start:71 stop:247 length:177 start_codon:yes stop_codon:yes gene_type:complete
MADIDGDKRLDFDEFCIMMVLVQRANKMGLSPIPRQLPWALVSQFNETKSSKFLTRCV